MEKVTAAQMKAGITRFAEKELFPKMYGLKGFGLELGIALALENADAMLQSPIFSDLGIKDENNMIDIEKLYGVTRNRLEKRGKITFAGLTLTAEDVDAMYREILAMK